MRLATLLKGAGYLFNISRAIQNLSNLLWCFKAVKLVRKFKLQIFSVSTINYLEILSKIAYICVKICDYNSLWAVADKVL